MNRKISTLLTAGLLMAGSLCGSAWAQEAYDPTEGCVPLSEADGGLYLLKATHYVQYQGQSWSTHERVLYVNVNEKGEFILSEEENTHWSVSSSGVDEVNYTFTTKVDGKDVTLEIPYTKEGKEEKRARIMRGRAKQKPKYGV